MAALHPFQLSFYPVSINFQRVVWAPQSQDSQSGGSGLLLHVLPHFEVTEPADMLPTDQN